MTSLGTLHLHAQVQDLPSLAPYPTAQGEARLLLDRIEQRFPPQAAQAHLQGQALAQWLSAHADADAQQAILEAALDHWVSTQAGRFSTNYAALQALVDSLHDGADPNTRQAAQLLAATLAARVAGLLGDEAKQVPRHLAPQAAALAVHAMTLAGSASERRALLESLGPGGARALLLALGPELDQRRDVVGMAYGTELDLAERLLGLQQMLEAVALGHPSAMSLEVINQAFARTPPQAYDRQFAGITQAMSQALAAHAAPDDSRTQQALQRSLAATLATASGRVVLESPHLQIWERLQVLQLVHDAQLTPDESQLAAYLASEERLSPVKRELALDVLARVRMTGERLFLAELLIATMEIAGNPAAILQLPLEERRTWWNCHLDKHLNPLVEPFLTPEDIKKYLPEAANQIEERKKKDCLTLRYAEDPTGVLSVLLDGSGTYYSSKKSIEFIGFNEEAGLQQYQRDRRNVVTLHEFAHHLLRKHCDVSPERPKGEFVQEKLLCEADAILWASERIGILEERANRSQRWETNFTEAQEQRLRAIVRDQAVGKITRDRTLELIVDMIREKPADGSETSANRWERHHAEYYDQLHGQKPQ